MNILNPILYEQLRLKIGPVRISHQGIPFRATYRPNWHRRNGKVGLRADIIERGESYNVNCPFCGEHRGRLSVCHHWAERDLSSGDFNLHLAKCFNETDCLNNGENQRKLHALLYPHGHWASRVEAAVKPAAAPAYVEPVTPEMPGRVTRLDRLKPWHRANAYLAKRHYNPELLGRAYGVCYCEESTKYYLADKRIIVPVYQDHELQGWQARFVGDMDWKAADAPPKWWTMPGMRKGQLLYNYDNAVKYETGVVMEAAGCVWGLGSMGMAAFGSTISTRQQELLVSGFGQHNLVILMDGDLHAIPGDEMPEKKKAARLEWQAKYAAMVQQMRPNFKGGVASVVLPADKDPDDYARDYLRDLIAAESEKQGVIVSWKLRSAPRR